MCRYSQLPNLALPLINHQETDISTLLPTTIFPEENLLCLINFHAGTCQVPARYYLSSSGCQRRNGQLQSRQIEIVAGFVYKVKTNFELIC